jgi:hypothetical protein
MPEAAGVRTRARLLAAIVLIVLSCAPSIGTLGAPLIAEDAMILGYVEREGGWSDWTTSQYQLVTVLFWRPVVTLSWAVQLATTGTAVMPLRLFNLAAHAAGTLLCALLARRLGLGRRAAFVAGLLFALFPEQGGSVTWIAGRTDTLSTTFLLGALVLALDRRPLLAALTTFLACATKETGFLAPAALLVCAWGRGESWRACLRSAASVTLASAVAFAWRMLAIGEVVGGYASPPLELLEAAPRALLAWLGSERQALALLVIVASLGTWARAAAPRVLAAGLALALLGALPLLELLAQGQLAETNARLLRTSDVGLCLAAAASIASASGVRVRWVLSALLVWAGWRGVAATLDAREWARAAAAAAAHEQRARAAVAADAPSDLPVFVGALPGTVGGAYALSYGFADRFRSPFEATPRPVWPLRTVFGHQDSERALPGRTADGLWRPLDATDPLPGALAIDAASVPLLLDESIAFEPDASPVLRVRGARPGERYELVLYTEIGYEPAGWSPSDLADPERLSLRRVLLARGPRFSLGDALRQAADFFATRAYLEIRRLDDSGAIAAKSDWIELAWSPDTLARIEARLRAADER